MNSLALMLLSHLLSDANVHLSSSQEWPIRCKAWSSLHHSCVFVQLEAATRLKIVWKAEALFVALCKCFWSVLTINAFTDVN